MGKLTKEEIILLFLDDPKKLGNEILYRNVPKSDEIRTLICELGNPGCAYWYALCIDKSPRSDTRKASCRDPEYAYYYARNIDKSPRSDTRESACKDPRWKKEYEKWENSLKKK